MAAKMVSLRLPEELAAWAEAYAAQRGVSRTDLLIEGLVSFREDCERGVPEIREQIREVVRGVGDCPKSDGGHVFRSHAEDSERRCRHCGLAGRLSRPNDKAVKETPNHLDQATAARAALFAGLKPRMVNGSGKAEA